MDIELLRRFVLGACDEAERESIARWVGGDPARRDVIDAVRRLAREPGAWTQRFQSPPAWARLLAASGRREPVVRVRHEPGLRRPVRVSHAAVVWSVAAAMLIALGANLGWLPLARLWARPRQIVAMRSVTTPPGQRAAITLGDGTRVDLAAGSRLTYAAEFAAGVRAVTLEGEAYFDVRHDDARPFEVRTRSAVIRDIGTAFLVRQYEGDTRLEVVVAAGRVAITGRRAGRPALVMNAGHLLRMDSGGRASVSAVDAQPYLGWMHGALVFDDTPLRDVAVELSRWYDADIRLADTSIAGRRFTGTFHGEPLDSVARALATPMHVGFERRGRTIIFSRLPRAR